MPEHYDNLLEKLTDPGSRPVMAAPLAGWTDSAYRKVLRQCGAVHLWIPFVSAHGLLAQGPNRDAYLKEVVEENGHVQIFGNDPETCARAAEELESAGAWTIDFNVGCSVKKVHKAGGGSSLLKDLDLLKENLSAIINAVSIPVSIKTRIGYFRENDESGLEACRIARDLGCAFVSLHGRTARQNFEGKADWSSIRRISEELDIPVIGNGDIEKPADVERMFEVTGCSGVMIGRGIMGNPWLVKDCTDYLAGDRETRRRSRNEVVQVMLYHQELLLEYAGRKKGVWEFRKHAAKYLRDFAQASKLRNTIVRLDDPVQVSKALIEFGEGRPPREIVNSVKAAVQSPE